MTYTLIKYLCSSGIGPRRYCANLVFSGSVMVNDTISTDLLLTVDPEIDQIQIGDQKLRPFDRYVYLKANKPIGYVTTVSDERGRPIILDLLPKELADRRLYPVGRLDMQSSGLIVITDDGHLNNRLTHPRFMIEKEYETVLTASLKSSQITDITKGININGKPTGCVNIQRIDEPGQCKYAIIIREGRKHIVRRMMMAVGADVVSLKRVRIHTLTLGTLKEGSIEQISDIDLEGLKTLANRTRSP